jgi:antitoxin (DNA-binding transcriptional repressor) of toxin-antitoxin stability system
MCYTGSMQRSVSVQELCNTLSEVLRAVEGGERVTVTVDRRSVAELAPLVRHRVVTFEEAGRVASQHGADRRFVDR